MWPRNSRYVIGRRAGDDRGAAAVEFAIVLPILILLLFGIVQFSLAWNRGQGLHAAAREGARIGALPQTTESEVCDRTYSALDGSVPAAEATVLVNGSSSCGSGRPCNSGGQIRVEVSHDYDLQIPLWDGSGSVTLVGKGEFRCESGSA